MLQGCSSGGAFHHLAKRILDDGGVVYGCAYNPEKRTFECTSTDDVSLEKLQRSKYVESNIDNVYTKIKEQLCAGRSVLFCATPCQAAGLKRFLNKQYEKLVIVDFSCGGVPSQSFFFDYAERVEKKHKSRIIGVNFRDKYYNEWGEHCISFTFENGDIYRQKAHADPYFYCFLHKKIKRTSCVTCKFSDNHYSDLILADFWKYTQITGKSGDTTGISLVLCQTDVGKKMMASLLDDPACDCQEIELEPACYNIKASEGGHADIKEAQSIHDYISKHGIDEYYRHFVPLTVRLKSQIKRLLKK